MGACIVVFVIIQKKLAEKIYPRRISIFSPTTRKTDFLLGGCTEHFYFLHPISVRPTRVISFNSLPCTYVHGELGGRICMQANFHFFTLYSDA